MKDTAKVNLETSGQFTSQKLVQTEHYANVIYLFHDKTLQFILAYSSNTSQKYYSK